MRRASLVILMALTCRMSAVAAEGFDLSQPLTGKYLHVLGGMAMGLAAAGVVDATVDPSVQARYPWLVPASAFAGAALAGIAKEVLDSTGFGDPQFSDILITSTGGIAAALVMGYAQSIYPQSQNGQMNSASFAFTLATLIVMPVINGFLVEIRRYEARQGQSSR